MGSVPWMAPEVLCDEPDIDYELSDVYSFGKKDHTIHCGQRGTLIFLWLL